MEVPLVVVGWHGARYFQPTTPSVHHHALSQRLSNLHVMVVQGSVIDVRWIDDDDDDDDGWLKKRMGEWTVRPLEHEEVDDHRVGGSHT